MKELNYTRDELNKLETFDKGGFEGRILIYNDDFLLKAFEPYLRNVLDFERKKLKLIRLNEKNIDGFVLVKPEVLVNVDGQFEGYIMQKINEGRTIHSFNDFRDLINLYKKLFRKLEIIHKNNIIVGDVKPANIVVEEDEPVFIDVDSMAVDEYDMDHEAYYSMTTKTIPNLFKKIKNNNETEIDKLKLLACFLYSINKGETDIYKKLFDSDLSNTFKREVKQILDTDSNLNISKNIHELFHEESKHTR